MGRQRIQNQASREIREVITVDYDNCFTGRKLGNVREGEV